MAKTTAATPPLWTPEPSAGSYSLYRGLMSGLFAPGFGSCEQQGLTDPTTTDTDTVPMADGYFYLVTVDNLLHEEGPKGLLSDGTQREGAVCP